MSSAASLRQTRLPRNRDVLLLVDVVNPLNFPGADVLLPGAVRAARATLRLREQLEGRHVPVIYANDNYGTWHSEFSDLLAACRQLPGARGELARLMSPRPRDLTLLKPCHSAFQSTPLLHLLRQMGTQRVIVAGLAADMCVMLSATDARMLGYDVWVPGDCTAAESPARKRNALRQLEQAFRCDVRPGVSASGN
ncbi:isochorismatase family cysteine hydrolase [Paracidovorax citrulli]|uniref:Isochorismatase family cysteine hydrolase n=1 Tax=Paracidovorax citrulli TaxID=80869 RepID=A0ABY9ATW7_PARCI|nr:isochorismatase family cysteine hydrolase [Paracidovorax citrulli]ATG93624.1 cysteine hydrolase [Paracidovorax citrulli]MVT27796.1 isochorismatase family protein [Paracidovorax citrulli]MVT37057.1 isochorismatase family protein [Paracidovorax citrulli]PVY63551.1 nicotinamidase-related amidase [Paracidovorax citrulli]REG67483.1 nicotinamidase-related amidase [Paracidovorax citrulli]